MINVTKKTRILIADDTASIRKLISVFLLREGYEIIEASNGEEALELTQKENPDLILLDIMMPKMFGWDVLKEIKKENRTAKVIIMTAVYKKNSYKRDTIHDFGADGFMTKPLDMPQLVNLIKNTLTNDSALADRAEGLASL